MCLWLKSLWKAGGEGIQVLAISLILAFSPPCSHLEEQLLRSGGNGSRVGSMPVGGGRGLAVRELGSTTPGRNEHTLMVS